MGARKQTNKQQTNKHTYKQQKPKQQQQQQKQKQQQQQNYDRHTEAEYSKRCNVRPLLIVDRIANQVLVPQCERDKKRAR
jgi:hypothetical protein